MKTKSLIILSIISTVILLSCDVPLALGNLLDIAGPVVEITSPVPRKTVPVSFELAGWVSDYSGIDRVEINAQLNRSQISKKWRYYRGSWEVSENSGVSWQPLAGAQWNGDNKNAFWVVPIDMNTAGGNEPSHGEYLFTVQAWDTGGFSDDNSFRTIVLIYDKDPPKVEIAKPNLYNRFAEYNGSVFTGDGFTVTGDELTELNKLHGWTNYDTRWQAPEMLGKFLTQGFQLQWQIEDEHDIWSFELRFYDVNDTSVVVDEDPDTPLPDSDYFRYWQNLGKPPDEPRPQDYPKPNGTISVPSLHDPSLLGDNIVVGSGEYSFIRTIDVKTTIKVVSRCFDAAGHVNHEKTLGYFIYWKEAGKPWISFTEGMKSPDAYNNIPPEYENDRKEYLTAEALMIYPGRSIKSTALQAHGVTHVEFSLYEYIIAGNNVGWSIDTAPVSLSYMDSMATEGVDFEYVPGSNKTRIRLKNEMRSSGAYSQIFSWDLRPPPQTKFYVIRAQAYSGSIESDEFVALFRVQDISFPMFGEPSPSASDPLFMHINTSNNTITIEGKVTDATEIVSLTMVWINPESRGYAAMSQLQYFRDEGYNGWRQAKTLAKDGASSLETANPVLYPPTPPNGYPFDSQFPNRLWNLGFTWEPEVDDDERQVFTYKKTINLANELNISASAQPLRSQMFLLRAENPDGRVTIITYAPQGDTLVPTIDITEVRILRTSADTLTLEPREYKSVRQFQDNDVIEVYGTWSEDSTGYLNVNNYLYNNMVFNINSNRITGSNNTTMTITPGSGTATSGNFVLRATLGSTNAYTIQTSTMKDTLVVDAFVQDIGGNKAESSASWLIDSDRLRFLRVSSEIDGAFNSTNPDRNKIRIYLEFSKPVRLSNQGIKPELILNSAANNAARAIYDDNQGLENTRQYFTYTVAAGHNTTALDVTGLYYNGVVAANDWNNANYAFVWVHRGELIANELMSITMDNNHASDPIGYARLPTGNTNNRSLMSNKEITVDTTAPTFSSVTATPAGWLNEGDINIRVTFSEPVKIGATAPYLVLTGGTAPNNRALFSRASGNTITFVYTVSPGDNTNGAPLQITSCAGQISDIPGTAFVNSGLANRELTGVYLDTSAPKAPTVNIRSGNPLAVISNTIYTPPNSSSGTPTPGTSAGLEWTGGASDIVDLKNVYHGTLNLQITANSTGVDTDLFRTEYSINNGTDWIAYNGGANGITWNTSQPQGEYKITARQIDRAGNISLLSKPVVFNWDRDPLITSITSDSANGTYTNNSEREDSILITVNLRKQLIFSGNVTITLNSRTTGNFTINSPGNTSRLTLNYGVGANDNTPTTGTDQNQRLNVTNITSVNARDNEGVDVSSMITAAAVPTGQTLNVLKNIRVKTGPLTVVNPPTTFTTAGATVNADGSYSTTLVINYSDNIIRGTGFITITQSESNYRIPAVLTEAQRNRYRSALIPATFDGYYTRGTNGFSTSSADTTVKYILNYNINPANLTAGAQQTFASNFRTAERIQINANATSSVTINGNQLTIHLTGTNALQVPGATYVVNIDEGFVQDELSNQSPSFTNNITAGGVAKPFIRINRQQETITVNTGANATTPRFTPEFPLQTQVRMDCRTPGATIRYNATPGIYTATASNWYTANGNNASALGTGVAGDGNNNYIPAAPTLPATNTNTAGTEYTAPITIGNTDYEGYIWRVNARAFSGANNSTGSEEIAYRTVLTYVVANMANPGGSTRQRIGNGMQIWIRGGDAIGSSTVPGFPLTWEDDWGSLDGRAGIRLLRKTGAANTELYNTTWQWVTWEVNVPAYFDIILGNEENTTNTTASIITRYGPRQWAYQAAGWTMFKEYYKMYPGKHRWLATNMPANLVATNQTTITIDGTSTTFNGVGVLNFSATWSARPEFTSAP
jgi:hypothetical protein